MVLKIKHSFQEGETDYIDLYKAEYSADSSLPFIVGGEP